MRLGVEVHARLEKTLLDLKYVNHVFYGRHVGFRKEDELSVEEHA